MRSWLISVPVWRAPYVEIFTKYAVPALRAALADFREPYRFLIHTDSPDAIRRAMDWCDTVVSPVSTKPTYVTLQESHGEAVSKARIGEAVVLLNADLVVSGNLIQRCAEHFDSGYRAVVLLGIRTDPNGSEPPVGSPPRALLDWAWEHRHQIIRDLEWESGTSMLPTNLFFTGASGSVVARGFHLHPVAVLKEAEISFISTIDGDLLDHFPMESIHVVTDPDDLSMLEISASDRRFPVRADRKLSPALVAASMKTRASELHKWLFTHPITVRGDGRGLGDEAVAHAVLEHMNHWSARSR